MTHAKIEAYYIVYLMIVALRGSKPVLPILRHEHTGMMGYINLCLQENDPLRCISSA